MLSIRDSNYVDLTVNPPAPVTLTALSEAGWPYTLTVKAVEDDANLPVQDVEVAVDWGDGNIQQYSHTLSSAGTLSIQTTHTLPVGRNVVRVEAQNYRAPNFDLAGVNFSVIVNPRVQQAVPTRIVFGPILPKDVGYPNSQQWNFNSGNDLEILASSVKMVLITKKGERIMEPEYGTNLHSLLFEQNTQALQEMAQQEVVDSMTRWEPRVALVSLSVSRPNDRSVQIDCVFESKLTQQTFAVSTTFEP